MVFSTIKSWFKKEEVSVDKILNTIHTSVDQLNGIKVSHQGVVSAHKSIILNSQNIINTSMTEIERAETAIDKIKDLLKI